MAFRTPAGRLPAPTSPATPAPPGAGSILGAVIARTWRNPTLRALILADAGLAAGVAGAHWNPVLAAVGAIATPVILVGAGAVLRPPGPPAPTSTTTPTVADQPEPPTQAPHGLLATRRLAREIASTAEQTTATLGKIVATRLRLPAEAVRVETLSNGHDGYPQHATIHLPPGQKVDLAELADAISDDLDIAYQTTRRPGRVDLRRVIDLPFPAHLPDDHDPVADPARLLLGTSTAGPIWWDTTRDHHLLIAAGSGWGKSTILDTLIWQATLAGWHVTICDQEAPLAATWEHVQGVDRVAVKLDEIRQTLEDELVEIEARRSLFRTCHSFDQVIAQRGRRLVVIDEFNRTMRPPASKNQPDYELRTLLREHAIDLGQLGRKWGVEVIGGAQRPDARNIDGELRDQFHGRLGGWLRKSGWEMVHEDRPPRRLPRLPGRGWWIDEQGEWVEIQCYLLTDEQYATVGARRPS